MNLELRAPRRDEVSIITDFIHQLAEYEKLAHECTISDAEVESALFGERPYAETMIAFLGGEPVGFCLFFHNFSTFLGKPGLYLEDLFVKPEYRNKGIGKIMLGRLAQLAIDRGCGRFEWSVLDWNEPSIAFYRKIGAVAMDGWTLQRVTGQALADLATYSS